jgi:SAM-dependent methyltransferase
VERIELDKVTPLIQAEHAHRYRWAASLARGRVLDAACGVGYGADILCAHKGVTGYSGLDRSDEALEIARRDFAGDNRSFVQGDVYALPFADASFDTIVSLETIEHLEHPERAMAEFRRVLKPGGVLLGSVPSKKFEDACRDAYGPNEFHKCEFDDAALTSLIESAFPHSVQWDCWLQIVSVLGLKDAAYAKTWEVDAAAPAMTRLGSLLFAASTSRESLRSVNNLATMIVYPATSVVEHERATITWRDQAIRGQEKTITERIAQVKRLEERLAASVQGESASRDEFARALAQAQDRIKDFAAANAKQAQMIDERVALIRKQDELVALRDATIAQQKSRVHELDQALAAARQQHQDTQAHAQQLESNLNSKIVSLSADLAAAQASIAAMSAEIAAKTAEIKQVQAALDESQTLVKHQAELIDKRAAFIKHLETLIVERDQAIRDQTRMIQDRDEAIRSQTRMIDERDLAIKNQTGMIDARDGWIRNLRAEVAALKSDLQRQKSWSASLEMTLSERDLSLTQLEERLHQRDLLLSDATTRYTTLISDLDRPLFCIRRTAKAVVKKVHPSATSKAQVAGENGGQG